jgi:hypothetical protein
MVSTLVISEDTLETTTVDSVAKHRALTGFDRCDRCGAEAFVLADFFGSELTFCGHHGREYEEQLVIQGFSISDETHRINQNPSPSTSEID